MSTAVVFHSTDRPLQLDAAIRSFFKHCTDACDHPVSILYRATNSRQASLYRQLAREHPQADFIRQYDPAPRPATADTSGSVPGNHLDWLMPEAPVLSEGHDCLAVVSDLTVFTREFSIELFSDCLRRHPNALGCTFVLSYQNNWCGKRKWGSRRPDFEIVDTGVIKYRWIDAKECFARPFDCSSGVFRGADLISLWQDGAASKAGADLDFEPLRNLRPAICCPDEPLILQLPRGSTAGVNAPGQSQESMGALPGLRDVRQNRTWVSRLLRSGRSPHDESSAAFVPGDRLNEFSSAFAAGRRIDLRALEAAGKLGLDERLDITGLTAKKIDAVPLVSVVIPCFDQARYLPEAVGSVIAQSFADWELIIVNDGSPDDTSVVARGLIQNHPNHRIRLIEQKNGGLSCARNAGIRAARGAYILPLDADDWIAPNMLQLMVPILTEQPDIGIVYCDLRHFGAVEKVVQAPEYDFRAVCQRNGLSYCSLFRREAWESVGGYNRNMIWSYEDREFWIACGEKAFFAKRVPEVLFHYRVKQESMYTRAVLHDRENRARIVLNHPGLYSSDEVVEARSIWSEPTICIPSNLPKVSVILTTCNRPRGLERALGSLFDQSFRDFELIVVNDGGIDVQHVLARMPDCCTATHIRHSSIRGVAAARNTVFRLASGKYVAWLDDEHTFAPDHIERLVGFLEATKCRAAWFDSNNFAALTNGERSLGRDPVPLRRLIYERGVGIAAGDFDESLGTHAEWDYWLRLSCLFQPAIVSDHGLEIPRSALVRSNGADRSELRPVRA